MASRSLRKFGLFGICGFQFNLGQLGHTIDQLHDVGAEKLGDFLGRGIGIFDGVVQKGRNDRVAIELVIGQNACDFDRVGKYGSPDARFCEPCFWVAYTYARFSACSHASGS